MTMQQITLYQLNRLIQKSLEQNLESSYWVVAEIGEIRVNQKGHCYLELVEKEGQRIKAKARGNIWAYDFYNLNSLFRSVTGHPLKTGMKILARATVQLHEVYGLSLHVRDLDPSFTLGERARLRQQVLDRLTKEGVFQLNKELSLPPVPQRVAVVSSSTAAGLGDFMDQLMGNVPGYVFKVEIFDAVMQGDEAVHSIKRALDRAVKVKEQFDLIVLIRGGGSQVDLDCYDDYHLALAVAKCPLPVVTGIGHQRDDTIVDMVAHSKMKTPTAVAEFLINGMEAFDQQLNFQRDRIKDLAISQLSNQQTQLFGMLKNLQHSAGMAINNRQHSLQLQHQKLAVGALNVLKVSSQKLQQCMQSFKSAPARAIIVKLQELKLREATLKLADPSNILKRGYSITYLNGALLKTGTALELGDEIETQLLSRKFSSQVTKIGDERKKL